MHGGRYKNRSIRNISIFSLSLSVFATRRTPTYLPLSIENSPHVGKRLVGFVRHVAFQISRHYLILAYTGYIELNYKVDKQKDKQKEKR